MKTSSIPSTVLLAGLVFASPIRTLSQQSAADEGSIFNLDPFVVNTDNVGYQARNSLSATKFDIQVREVPITVTSLTGEYLEDTYSQSLVEAVRFSAGVTTGSKKSAEEEDGFFIRGLKTSRSKRNGVIQLYTQDMTNVAKVEVVKGPMSVLYGQVEPGGIINYLTLDALDEFKTDLKLTVGNYDHIRAQINHTGPILKGGEDGAGRLLYRMDSSYKKENGWRDNTDDERTFVSGLLEYKPFAATTVKLQWDYLNQNSFNAAAIPKINKRWFEIFQDLVAATDPADLDRITSLASADPWTTYAYTTRVFNTASGPQTRLFADESKPRLWDGYATHWDWKINPVPQNAFNDIDFHTASLEVRQKLWRDWFAKLQVVYNDIHRESVWGDLWGIGVSGEAGTGYSSNHWDRYNEDYAYQLEITGKWNLGPVNNQTIIGFEYLDNNYEGFVAIDGASNMIRDSIFQEMQSSPTNPYFILEGPFAVPVTNLGSIRFNMDMPLPQTVDEEKETKAAFISNVARLFDDRLLLLGGLRFDEITILRFGRNSEGEREQTSKFEEDSISPQIGTSFMISDALTLYASYSESFVPQSGSFSVLKQGEDLAAQLEVTPTSRDLTDSVARSPLDGSGYEFGAKFDLLDDRISGSMAVFHTELVGVLNTYFVEVPGFFLDAAQTRPQSVLVGSENNGREINGFETELFLRPFTGFQTVITYAYLDSVEILNASVNDIREGSQVPTSIPSTSVPRHQVGLWSKYTLSDGPFDGLSIGGGFSWMDERVSEFTLRSGNSSASTSPAFINGDEAVENRILLDDQITYELLLGYDFVLRGIDYTVQLNIKNLLDERFILPGGMPNEPRRIFASLQAKF